MKKFLSVVLAFTFILSLSLSVFAAGNNFVPSISEKPAPEIIEGEDNGQKFVGKIIDGDGEIKKKVPTGKLLVTPIADIDKEDELDQATKDELKAAYNELTKKDKKLSSICPELNKLVADNLGDGKDADNLVIRDFFDVTIIGDEYKEELKKQNHKFVVDLKVPVDKDAFVAATVFVDGKWQLVETVNNGDGTITCSFDSVCPVALFVEGTGGSDNPPPTGIGYENFTWIMLAIISLAAIVVLTKVIISKRTRTHAE